MLGFARAAGALAVGDHAAARMLATRRCGVVLLAADAGLAVRRKFEGMARAEGVPLYLLGDKASLGRAIGQGPVAVVTCRRGKLADALLERLSKAGEIEHDAEG